MREFALSERLLVAALNESPSEKEGKCPRTQPRPGG